MQPDELRPKAPGEPQTRENYNALVQAVKVAAYNVDGYHDPDTIGVWDRYVNEPAWWPCVCDTVNIEPFSVFTLKSSLPGQDEDPQTPPIHGIVSPKKDQTALLYLTNGETKISQAMGGKGYCRAIGDYIPTRLKIESSGPNSVPIPSRMCGPMRDSLGINLGGTGLICLALEKTFDGSDPTFAWVVASRGADVRLGKIKTGGQPLAPGQSADFEIWSGLPGAETNTQIVIKVCNRTSITIPTAKFCKITAIDGYWYAEPWEC
jgi:hypothetical protein